MLQVLSNLNVQGYNQTDRIQGMARYMNREGASSEVMTLLLIFAGMLTVVLLLKMVASHAQKKREAMLRQKLAKKKAATKANQSGRATRLR